ncbi:hypothetical protein A0J48_022925 [Sphaerospermopsis aphanizomenoides BCCUSP55]|uniref:hypothetical protein n=1 Tax=Sphaerospermopsis aphanizomenoides TaxID=459663 RepID=UPI001905101B|nr:hypothetical protein [Sphaerospermopsis aphanizomenoides]MBK1990340.1 hypothetical protein [Sphaerospermopsis aphanizomenoides BCCUSP55]
MAIAQKHKKNKALSISGEKILIVSGSNGLFGISAEKISQTTKIPTVNLAMHAGLGVEYILNDAKKVLKKGDIVLLPLEYNLYISEKDITRMYLKHIISNDTEYFWNNLNHWQKIQHLLQLSNSDILNSFLSKQSREEIWAGLKTRASQGKCYSGFLLNNAGDELCNINAKPLKQLSNKFILPTNNNYEIDKTGSIRDFINWCQQKQVKLLPLYPVTVEDDKFYQPEYKLFFQKIKNFYQKNGVSMLGDPYQATLPHKLMFNTGYHPNDQGREIRTQQVISLIQPYI